MITPRMVMAAKLLTDLRNAEMAAKECRKWLLAWLLRRWIHSLERMWQ